MDSSAAAAVVSVIHGSSNCLESRFKAFKHPSSAAYKIGQSCPYQESDSHMMMSCVF